MASPLPFTQLVTVLPTLDLSPQLTGNAESTNYSLHYTHPAPPSLLLTSYKADDGVDGSDSLDADSFTLYAPSAHHLVPLSPTSASSLSPPHSLSSASSVSSLSSPSPPPCSACPSCCGQVHRLSLLVPALRKKLVHTASLVSLYQSTRAHLTALEQRLQQSEREKDEARRLLETGEGRVRQLREEAERREVRLRAQESHIQQLKATHAKLSAEKEDREGRERSIREVQREHDGLLRRCEQLKQSTAQLQVKREEEERKVRAARAQKEQEEIEWVVDASDESIPIIIDLQPSLPTPAPQSPPHPTPDPPAVAGTADADGSPAKEVVDISATLQLVGEAMKKLKADLRAKNAVIRQLRTERKQYRQLHAEVEAGKTKGEDKEGQERDKGRIKRRRLSKGQVMVETTAEELEHFAADVLRAMEGGKAAEVKNEEEQQSGVDACKEEKKEEEVSSSRDDVIAVVTADLVVATPVTSANVPVSDAPAVLAQPVKRKRGRPRIHPLKEKKVAGVKRERKPRKTSSKLPSQSAQLSSATPPPSASPSVPTPHAASIPSPPATSSAPAQNQSSAEGEAQRPRRSFPHRPLPPLLQHFTTLLHAFCSTLGSSPSAQSSPPSAADAEKARELTTRMTLLLCPCPCSSTPPSSLLRPAATTAAPLALLAPRASLASLAFPHPLTASAANVQCSWCSSSSPTPLPSTSPRSCCYDDLLHWNDVIDVVTSLLVQPQSTSSLTHSVCELLIALDDQLTSKWKEQLSAANPLESSSSSSSLSVQFCSQSCVALLSSPSPSSSSPSFPLLVTVLQLASRCGQLSIVRALLVHSMTSSQPSLPWLERVASLCPTAFAVSSAPLSPTHHIKALRLITASCLLTLTPACTQPSSSSLPPPAYPTLTSLLSTELSSLSSASQHFVLSRFVSELLLHSTVATFQSHGHFIAAASSITAAFHLLFLFLSFPIAYSIVRQHILPSMPRCKTPLHTAILFLVLPSAFHSALTFLSSSSPATDKADLTSTRQALSALLRWTTEAATAEADVLVRGAACEVLVRVMTSLAQVKGRFVSKKADKEEALRVQRLWLRSVTVDEVAQMEKEPGDEPNGWSLLRCALREVRAMREEGRHSSTADT